ncbi:MULTISPECIES: entericidin A/B family lipoprotein [Cobetia]|uniref:Entericidin A/B family lipoprotein n=1 Tax=Cobetia crustatorum TaxID=553385 RepID=A0A558HUV5_9GAMM|nr:MULTISPECIES: entericidin A/B family lipoprotein [Cobetia]TVU72886.1 entericidin A/B family lipoprotein [Cobetia crustatorum]
MRRFMMMTGSALLLSLFLGGCNTVEGFGEDLEHLGGSIEDSAS